MPALTGVCFALSRPSPGYLGVAIHAFTKRALFFAIALPMLEEHRTGLEAPEKNKGLRVEWLSRPLRSLFLPPPDLQGSMPELAQTFSTSQPNLLNVK